MESNNSNAENAKEKLRKLRTEVYVANVDDYQHLDWDESFHKGIEIGIEAGYYEAQAENKRLLSLNEGLVEALKTICVDESYYPRLQKSDAIGFIKIAKKAIEANNLK